LGLSRPPMWLLHLPPLAWAREWWDKGWICLCSLFSVVACSHSAWQHWCCG
jgi:hypothetical protein